MKMEAMARNLVPILTQLKPLTKADSKTANQYVFFRPSPDDPNGTILVSATNGHVFAQCALDGRVEGLLAVLLADLLPIVRASSSVTVCQLDWTAEKLSASIQCGRTTGHIKALAEPALSLSARPQVPATHAVVPDASYFGAAITSTLKALPAAEQLRITVEHHGYQIVADSRPARVVHGDQQGAPITLASSVAGLFAGQLFMGPALVGWGEGYVLATSRSDPDLWVAATRLPDLEPRLLLLPDANAQPAATMQAEALLDALQALERADQEYVLLQFNVHGADDMLRVRRIDGQLVSSLDCRIKERTERSALLHAPTLLAWLKTLPRYMQIDYWPDFASHYVVFRCVDAPLTLALAICS